MKKLFKRLFCDFVNEKASDSSENKSSNERLMILEKCVINLTIPKCKIDDDVWFKSQYGEPHNLKGKVVSVDKKIKHDAVEIMYSIYVSGSGVYDVPEYRIRNSK